MQRHIARLAFAGAAAFGLCSAVLAQPASDIRAWLLDVNTAAQQQTFAGTMVVLNHCNYAHSELFCY